jgi:hypothetical protein
MRDLCALGKSITLDTQQGVSEETSALKADGANRIEAVVEGT